MSQGFPIWNEEKKNRTKFEQKPLHNNGNVILYGIYNSRKQHNNIVSIHILIYTT